MIIIWIAILVLLGLFGYWLLSSSNRYNRELIQRAKEAEETQKYEDAILQKDAAEWKEKYFKEIIFPIVILAKKDYLAVSSLVEYYIDVDINIWGIKSGDELVDSLGQKYDFQQIENEQWVPNKKIGTMNFDELKNRLTPLLYMPNHKNEINTTKTTKEIIELLLKD
jgi:hypothetical protein